MEDPSVLYKFEDELIFDFGVTTPTVNLFSKLGSEVLKAPKKINKHRKNMSLTQKFS